MSQKHFTVTRLAISQHENKRIIFFPSSVVDLWRGLVRHKKNAHTGKLAKLQVADINTKKKNFIFTQQNVW